MKRGQFFRRKLISQFAQQMFPERLVPGVGQQQLDLRSFRVLRRRVGMSGIRKHFRSNLVHPKPADDFLPVASNHNPQNEASLPELESNYNVASPNRPPRDARPASQRL